MQSQGPTPTPSKISKEQQNKPTPKKTQRNNNQRGTDDLPLVVKVVKTLTPNDTNYTNEKPPTDWWKIIFDALLVIFTGTLAGPIIKLWQSTEKLWKTAQDQSKDMGKSITAMESPAKYMEENSNRTKEFFARQELLAKIQLRAYLTVNPAGYFLQNKELKQKCGIQMFVLNTGHTPARDVCCSIRAIIADTPLPGNINLSLPSPQTETTAGGQIATGQQRFWTAFLDDFISDEEMKEIIQGDGRKL